MRNTPRTETTQIRTVRIRRAASPPRDQKGKLFICVVLCLSGLYFLIK